MKFSLGPPDFLIGDVGILPDSTESRDFDGGQLAFIAAAMFRRGLASIEILDSSLKLTVPFFVCLLMAVRQSLTAVMVT